MKLTSPTGILVTAQGDILYQHGRSGLYLEPVPGEPGISNILKMARDGLRRELTISLHRAVHTGLPVLHNNLIIQSNGHAIHTHLSLCPISIQPDSGSVSNPSEQIATAPSLYLVILGEADASPDGKDILSKRRSEFTTESDVPASGPDTFESPSVLASTVDALRLELKVREDYLQATQEELETAGEELKSSNEEMQSVNEELQSTNEELETSKEELQSINEELATVNAELQAKVTDLSAANNDMNNLLAGTGIATVFVDHDLRILRFTPAASNIINLIISDMGRPVSHIVTKLVGYDRLVRDIQSVLDTLVPVEVNVQTEEERWYTMRIQPYRTVENVIEGAVITFVDITEMKRVWESLSVSEARYRQLFEAVQEGILIMDAETGLITDVNPYLTTLTGYARTHFVDRCIWDITLLKGIVPDCEHFAALQKQNYVRTEHRQVPTANNRMIAVEFISNVHQVGSKRFMQCNIRRLGKEEA